jgi:hypothetical protein
LPCKNQEKYFSIVNNHTNSAGHTSTSLS